MQLFGFCDDQVQQILKSMEQRGTHETNIVFCKREDVSSPQPMRSHHDESSSAINVTTTAEHDDDGDDASTTQQDEMEDVLENEKSNKNHQNSGERQLFHGMSTDEWISLLQRYRSMLRNEIEACAMRIDRLRTKRNKRTRVTTAVDGDMRRENEKRQKMNNTPNESQDTQSILEVNLLSLVTGKTSTSSTVSSSSLPSNSTRRDDKGDDDNNATRSTETAAHSNHVIVEKQMNDSDGNDNDTNDQNTISKLNDNTFIAETQVVDYTGDDNEKELSFRHKILNESKTEINNNSALHNTSDLFPTDMTSLSDTLVFDYNDLNDDEDDTNVAMIEQKPVERDKTVMVDSSHAETTTTTIEKFNHTTTSATKSVDGTSGIIEGTTTTAAMETTTTKTSTTTTIINHQPTGVTNNSTPKNRSLNSSIGQLSSPELIMDQPSVNRSASMILTPGNNISASSNDETIDLETLCSPVTAKKYSSDIFDQKKDDQPLPDEAPRPMEVKSANTSHIHTSNNNNNTKNHNNNNNSTNNQNENNNNNNNNNYNSRKEETQEDDDVVDDETLTDIQQVIRVLPHGEATTTATTAVASDKRELIASLELLEVLSGTQVPTSPQGTNHSMSSDEDETEHAALGSPILAESLSPQMIEDDDVATNGAAPTQTSAVLDADDDDDADDPTQVHQEDAVDETTKSTRSAPKQDATTSNGHEPTESPTAATANSPTPIPSVVKPKMSQHSLPRHPITKINQQNPLMMHSKFSLHKPVSKIRFSPHPNLATFAACTTKLVAVWDLNMDQWEMIEKFEFHQEGECISNIQYTPDGEKLIIAGVFAEVVQLSQDLLFTSTLPSTQYDMVHQIRIYDLTGESLVSHAMGRQIEPSITIRDHHSPILDMIVSEKNCCLISTDESGAVLKHTFNSEWTQRESVKEFHQVPLSSINNNNSGTNSNSSSNKSPVVSLSFVPGEKFQRLLVGFTRYSVIMWEYLAGRCLQNVRIPNTSIFKGHIVGGMDQPQSGIFPVLLYTTPSTSQVDVRRTALYFVGHNVELKKRYERLEAPTQTSNQSTPPCRDNVLELTIQTNATSRYLVSGTDRGRILLFNYWSGQCVGILVDMHEEPISSLAFHDHLPLVAVGGRNGTIIIYYQST